MRENYPPHWHQEPQNEQFISQTDYLLAHPGSSYALVKAWIGAQAPNDMNSQRHEDHAHSRYPGSCEWLASHPDFVSWVERPPSDRVNHLWLKGSPGAGKSHVCSKAIDHVVNTQELCLYYFYRFDYQFETDEIKLQISSLLIDQLFRQVWRDDPTIAGRICQFTETQEKNTTTLAQIGQMLLKTSKPEGSPDPTRPSSLYTSRRKLYVLLDGLDEVQGPFTGDDVLKLALSLFNGLEEEVCLRLWVSSRDSTDLSRSLPLAKCTMINLDDHAEPDVRNHLAREVTKIMDLSPELTAFEIRGKSCE